MRSNIFSFTLAIVLGLVAPVVSAIVFPDVVVAQTVEQKRIEADRLETQATTQMFNSQLEAAHQSMQQARKIYRSLDDRPGELKLLVSFTSWYFLVFNGNDVAFNDRVFQYSEQALSIAREIRDRETEGQVLRLLGSAHVLLGNPRKAIQYHEQELRITRELQQLEAEGFALGALGDAYLAIEDTNQAINYYNQWLTITRKLQNIFHEKVALEGLGKSYTSLGDYARALEYHQKSREITAKQEKKNPEAEGFLGMDALQGIGDALDKQGQSELAIIFYKKAVNTLESSRHGFRENFQQWEQSEFKPSDEDRAFNKFGQGFILRDHTPMYRRLADLLLRQNRVFEALQVLDLLKIEDLQGFSKENQKNALLKKGIELLSQETEIFKVSSSLSIQTILQNDAIQSQVQNLRKIASEQNLKLESYQNTRNQLQKLGKNAALFYPLILDDRLEIVILTNDRPPIHKPVPISRKQLETEVTSFRNQLQNRSRLIKEPAQKLYQSFIQPIEAELKASGVDTIVYAPDDIMRYVPLAALHDGKQWLAERYQINYLTALALTPLEPDPNKTPKVLAAALTEAHQIKVLGQTVTFPALQFTQPEIETLAKTIPNTTSLINQSFSRQNLTTGIPNHTILHLATHGMFVPNSPDQSIIVMGDGSTISLREIEQQWKLPNVSLVVLSACETAIGGKLGNGIEILGFGYQMQRIGSRASISSLWTIDDGGTQGFMNTFYTGLKQGKTPAFAIQQTQKDFIQGKITQKDIEQLRGAVRYVKGGIPTDLTHPFYWAPFILVGNGL